MVWSVLIYVLLAELFFCFLAELFLGFEATLFNFPESVGVLNGVINIEKINNQLSEINVTVNVSLVEDSATAG